MPNVAMLLKNKGNNVWTISPGATVMDALKLMAVKNVGALPVVEGGKIVGFFSERDFARKTGAEEKLETNIPVSALMSTVVYSVSPDETIERCMEIMTRKRIRHLPVIAGGKLAGLVSIGDIVNAMIKEQKDSIEQLQNYISGTR